MDRKTTEFLVAGAGHGGLCAALHLVRAGCGVQVVESQSEETLGYDWTDVFEYPVLERNGFTPLSKDKFYPVYYPTMLPPNKKYTDCPAGSWTKRPEMYVERRELLKSLVSDCKAAGVSFIFGAKIVSPIISENKVSGLNVVTSEGENAEIFADMVIDAAGADSPVRKNLPDNFNIPKALKSGQTFYTWRGDFKKASEKEPCQPYRLYLDHKNRPGISWVITTPHCMDVLLGNSIKPLTKAEVDDALEDLRNDNPLLSADLIRGGYATIPVRRFIGLMVASGYAAVGNSAFMADPFSGSGISPSIDNGRVLSEVLMSCKGDYSVERLWEYQYRVFTRNPKAEGALYTTAAENAGSEAFKNGLLGMNPKDLNRMFVGGLIAARVGLKGVKQVFDIFIHNIPRLPLIAKIGFIAIKKAKAEKLAHKIPKEYDSAAVIAWVKKYEDFK
ncbi:MAG: NAD(P)/FAD-dependent oxidoreductase [Christensenellaceae bacterium]|nr:NAD(P)/FAD-dependent oxidoreductase [Christensenellaceae bacterium]